VNKITPIKGKRFHIAGSSDSEITQPILIYAHKMVKQLAKSILQNGGGLVVTVGSEPIHPQSPNLPLIFDWTLLEAVDELDKEEMNAWPQSQGKPVVVVGLPKWKQKLPKNRKQLWSRIISDKKIEIVQIKAGLRFGGILRQNQASFGDVLIAIGGGPGVYHLSELYRADKKPVIPLDLPIKTKSGAAQQLAERVLENPEKFFSYNPPEEANTAFCLLSLKDEFTDVETYSKKILDFCSHLPKPQAFFVRLLNPKVSEFTIVENFFRRIVDPVIKDSGYKRFESGIDVSREPFLNVEIFKELHYSSLVIVDLTCLRPNCFLELGYALALGKKVVLTAHEGTKLPFDSVAIPCHFWSETKSDEENRTLFEEFMNKNIVRNPIIN
jgi:hypothetical protein